MTKQEMLEALRKAGCLDSGCPIAPPGGMRTNGGCRCWSDLGPGPGMAPSQRALLRTMSRLVRELVMQLPDEDDGR